MELKGSRTEQNLKDAFAGESQANRRLPVLCAEGGCRGLQRRVRGLPFDPPKERPDTLTVTSSTSRRSVTRHPGWQSVRRPTISRLRLPARRTSTRTCIPACQIRTRRGNRRDRRLVRDPREGRTLARESFSEGSRQSRRLIDRCRSCGIGDRARNSAADPDERIGERCPGGPAPAARATVQTTLAETNSCDSLTGRVE